MSVSVPNEFLDKIYEASVVPELWPDVLQRFRTVADGKAAALLASSGPDVKWIGCSPLAEQIAQKHYSYAGGRERTRRLMTLPHAGFLTDLDVFSEEEFFAEPLFAEYLIPNGFGRGIATAINIPTGETIAFHVEGDFSKGPLSRETRDQLDGIRPHLARSSLLSARLAFERSSTAVETLSSIGLAACAVAVDGTVIVGNREFDAEAGIWTTRGGNRLALLQNRADRQLYEALSAIRTHQGVRSIALLGQEDNSPSVLHVVPIRGYAHDIFSRAGAILVLTKASKASTQATSILQVLFDLSPAEAVVASRIAAGETVTSIAKADARSPETVRVHLKSVLTKTGCGRQSDLVRLLVQLVPPSMG